MALQMTENAHWTACR